MYALKKDDLIVKHNSLIRSRYDYTLAELRLVITIASMIEVDDEDFRTYSVPAKEYADLMDAKPQNYYQSLQKLGEMLLSKPLKIPEKNGFLICNWFSSYRYNKGEGTITVFFDPSLKPYLLQIREMFTKYRLENILRFKSVYSIRIYELAKSWETRGEFAISIDEFKDIIGAAKKYTAYYDFKRYVLERSLKEINALSDITLTFREKKLGRKVTDLVFSIKPNLPKSKNYLASERAFIAYMRKHHINDTLYDGPTESRQRVQLAISQDGRIYDKITSKTYTADKSKTVWSWLYQLAKEGRLSVLRQTSIDE